MEFTIHTIETTQKPQRNASSCSEDVWTDSQSRRHWQKPRCEGMALWDLFETTSFTPIERQVIYLTANYVYVTTWQLILVYETCMLPTDINALRNEI